MKLSLLLSMILLFNIQVNASRIKKDLLPSKEQEIITLLQEKIKTLDRLIQEAKIYSQEEDPLVKNNFYNNKSGFVTKSSNRSPFIETNTYTTDKTKKKKRKGYLSSSGNKMSVPRQTFVSKSNKRDILGITMQMKDHSKVSYRSYRDFFQLMEKEVKKGIRNLHNKSQRKTFSNLIDETYEKKFEILSNSIKSKYAKVISLLSTNRDSSKFNSILNDKRKAEWIISAKMVLFAFDLQRDSFYKKKLYNLSIALDETFKDLQNNEGIKSVNRPNYYERKIDRNLRCLETGKAIKYKGRICINYIDVDKDRYFKKGVFETRENNFLQKNRRVFRSLEQQDKELKKASQEYIKFLIIKISTPAKKRKINLENGL